MAKSSSIVGGGPGAAALQFVSAEIGGTIQEFVEVIKAAVSSVEWFVAAISPSTMLAFNQALRDVSATVGSAFTGAFQIFADAAREVGGALLPAMQKLAPVVNTLANAVATHLTAGVRVVAAALEALAPVLNLVAESASQFSKFVSDMLGVLAAGLRVVASLVANFFGSDFAGGFREAFRGFLDVIRQAVKALVTFVSTLAVFAGFRDTVRAFADALAGEAKARDERASGLKAAAVNPQITDTGALLRQMQLASFIAAGGAGAREKSDTEWLKSIAESVRATTAKQTFREALQDWWNTEVVGGNGILGSVLRFVDGLKAQITNFFNRVRF